MPRTRRDPRAALLIGTLLLGCSPEPARPPATPAPASPAPANPSWSSAVTRGVRNGEYRIREEGTSFLAVNRAADLRARWSAGDGLSAWRSRAAAPGAAERNAISLKAVAVGRGPAARTLGARDFALGACRSDGVKDEHGACLRRLERDLGGLREWWENRGDGIAHGFVVERAPSSVAGPGAWLQVKVRVSGARIALAPDARGAMLTSRDQRFEYSGLAAWDADRKTLPTRMRRAGRHLLLEVDDRGARYPVVIDPVLTVHTWQYQSNQTSPPGDQPAGQDMVVAGAGDVNGDTHLDVLVSFPRYNSAAGNNSGIVYLFLGSPTGPGTAPAWSSEGSNVTNTAAAATPNSLFGRSIAAGRIDGDAFSDVVIGQVGWSNGESLEGRVYVFFGQPGASPLPALPSQVLEGRSLNALFGRAVALANLDGLNGADLIVGSSGFSANAGRVELYLASAAGAFPADGSPSATVVGAAGSSLGEAVAAGDTNADGRPDVQAGARTYAGMAGADEGAIYSLLTDAGGLVGTPFIFASGNVGGQLGKVAFAGDVNGDGFGDVLGGAVGGFAPAFSDANLVVLYGSPTGITATGRSYVSGVGTNARLGAAVAGPIDVNNDGFHDLVAGAPGVHLPGGIQGMVLVIRGSAAGPVASSTLQIDADSRFAGENPFDEMGSTVAVAGDINKDGFGDILAGAAAHETGQVDEGKAYIFLGGPPSAKQGGEACATNGECESRFCVDGFCCNSVCGGTAGVEADNTTDCQACSLALSGAPNGICDLVPVASACNSASACVMASICDETGACIGGVPRVCPAPTDGCHDQGVCDPATGACSNPPRANGTVCDDAVACTSSSTCVAGVCTAGTGVACAAPPVCKQAATCNTATGACVYANQPDGTTCSDGNMCTTGETCQGGACVTTPALTCGAESACKNAGSCDPATGVCAQTSKADGIACDDGNMCTLTTTCVAGACTGAIRSCDDGNPCTADSCAPGSGCVNSPIAGCGTDASTDADAAGDAGDGPQDLGGPADAPTSDATTDGRPTDTVSDVAQADGSTDRTSDVLITDAAATDVTTTDASRDGAASDALPVVKARGSGCDCGIGHPAAGGTLPPALLIALGLMVFRVRRRRRS